MTSAWDLVCEAAETFGSEGMKTMRQTTTMMIWIDRVICHLSLSIIYHFSFGHLWTEWCHLLPLYVRRQTLFAPSSVISIEPSGKTSRPTGLPQTSLLFSSSIQPVRKSS